MGFFNYSYFASRADAIFYMCAIIPIFLVSIGPVAYCVLGNKQLNVYKSLIRDEYVSKPGEILDTKKFIVGCKTGAIEFLTVQLQGKKIMSAKDFLNGHRLKIGDFLN